MVPSSFILGGSRPWRADQCAAGPDPRPRDIDRAFRDGSRSFLAQAIAAAHRYSDRSRHRRSLALVRAHQDGVAVFRNELARIPGRARWRAGYEASRLAGNIRACVVLGFLPGTALIGSAFERFWNGRDQKLARILAGLGDRLSRLSRSAVVEARHLHGADDVSGVGARCRKRCRERERPRQATGMERSRSWPTSLAACRSQFSPLSMCLPANGRRSFRPLLILLIVALFIWSGRQGREGGLSRWAAIGVAALGLFAITLLGVVLPAIDKIWPAEQIARRLPLARQARSISSVFASLPAGSSWVFRPHSRRSDALAQA